ncbi:MAG: competence protein TfoX [Bacteroidetes bacterium]|nr:MAG: competence protein TfoX [Bacteroidota bacterium]
MATRQEFVDFIIGQLDGCGEVYARKMFGDYALYLDGKVVGLICDGVLHIKPTDAGLAYADDLPMSPAYPGAKPSLCVGERVDNGEFLRELLRRTAQALPAPKPRKPRKPRKS